MSELTAPDSTSVGITRLGRTATTTADELGPLADLVGTWMGKGWELIAVPQGETGFHLIVRPYVEVLTVEPIGAPVPNRGPKEDMLISGLMYKTRITDRETHEPLHLENGMWLYLKNAKQEPVEVPIVRQASIPHGDVLLALGTSSTGQAPEIPTIKGAPEKEVGMNPGYLDPYIVPREGFDPSSPNQVLVEANKGLDIVATTTLLVSTEGEGGILNIPFVREHANATRFTCTYWLETVKGTKGEEVLQLQYSQQTNIEFLPKKDHEPGLIMWPHINVNTLRKQ
ncbi:MAG: heme-binding protein [Solirubrobacterales bacterium]